MPFIFAVFGALGGIVGAICGEALFLAAASRPCEIPTPGTPAKAVCLLLDCSGSMRGEKLTEVKQSAEDFAARQDLGRHEIAVVGFESTVHPVCPPTHDLGLIQAGVRQLMPAGGTGMAHGLAEAGETLRNSPLEKHILLFTDGMPDSKEDTLRQARSLRAAGIGIVVVATADADPAFLSRLTGSPERVMTTQMGSFDEAFDEAFHRAEEMIHRGLVDHSSVSGSVATVRTVGWSALLAAGVLFVGISYVLSDAGARITGAVALGACLGYMIALVESAWREAYLEVEWGPNETSVLNLGDKTILLGSSSECYVYLRDFPPVAATVALKQGRIAFEDKATGQAQELHDGNKLKIGTPTIHVHAHK